MFRQEASNSGVVWERKKSSCSSEFNLDNNLCNIYEKLMFYGNFKCYNGQYGTSLGMPLVLQRLR